MINLYLGDVSEYLCILACSEDKNAQLVTQNNFNNLLPGTYYTSIADIGNLSNLGKVLQQADQIIYAPPANNKWSDTKNGKSNMQFWTEDYLKIFSTRALVKNFINPPPVNKDAMLALTDLRKASRPQLWIAGCSVSHGTGVTLSERYGNLISNELKLEASFLTWPGSSIVWAADQILRSDIKEDDLIIWGLTATPRISYFNNNSLIHLSANSYNKNYSELSGEITLDYLTSENIQYQSISSIFQVINFCKKTKSKLLLVSLLNDTVFKYVDDHTAHIMLCSLWGQNQEDQFCDIGSDDIHPGPLTHKFYAEEILKKIKQLQWR